MRALAGGTLAMVLMVVLSSCAEEASEAKEGNVVSVDGVTYTVFITRQLNPRIPPDKSLYGRRPAPAGKVHLGVFLKACNAASMTRQSVAGFAIVDSAGNEFDPVGLASDNPFAYHQRRLAPGRCIPEEGAVAAMTSSGGALLLFELPLQALQNRPLVLKVGTRQPPDEVERIVLDL